VGGVAPGRREYAKSGRGVRFVVSHPFRRNLGNRFFDSVRSKPRVPLRYTLGYFRTLPPGG